MRWTWPVFVLATSSIVAGLVLFILFIPGSGLLPGSDTTNLLRDFELVDHNGKPFHRSDLDGSVWIANFIFTRCEGPCPMMSVDMNGLRKALPASVNFVSFSVDPTYDQPRVLADYKALYARDADSD